MKRNFKTYKWESLGYRGFLLRDLRGIWHECDYVGGRWHQLPADPRSTMNWREITRNLKEFQTYDGLVNSFKTQEAKKPPIKFIMQEELAC